jgi:hypothetical protein
MAFWNKKKEQQKPKLQHQEDDWEFKQRGRTEFHGPSGTRVNEDLEEGLNRITREQQAEAARQAKLDAKENADRVRQYQKDQKRQQSEAAFKQRQEQRYNEGQQSFYSKPGAEQSQSTPQSDYERIKQERDDYQTKFHSAFDAGEKQGFQKGQAKATGTTYTPPSEDSLKWKPRSDADWAAYYAEQSQKHTEEKSKLEEDLEVKAFEARHQRELDDARKAAERQEKLSSMGWIDRRKFTHQENVKEKLSAETKSLLDRYNIPTTIDEIVKIPGTHVPVLDKNGQPIFDKDGKPALTWVGEHLEKRTRPRTELEMKQAARDAQIEDINYHDALSQHRAQKVAGWMSPLTTAGKLGMAALAGGAAGAGEMMRAHGGNRGQMNVANRNFVPQPGGAYSPLYQINRPSAPIIRQSPMGFNPNGQSLAHLRNIQIVRNQNLNPVGSRTNLMQTRAPSTPQGVRGDVPRAKNLQSLGVRKMRLW